MPEHEELTCIACPTGCRLRRAEDGTVRGAGCELGRQYARAEWAEPRRVFTGTVRLVGGADPVVPVRSDGPVPRDDLLALARAAASVRAVAPVGAGECLAEGLPGDARLVATADAAAAT